MIINVYCDEPDTFGFVKVNVLDDKTEKLGIAMFVTRVFSFAKRKKYKVYIKK